jgi:hypothetical protein
MKVNLLWVNHFFMQDEKRNANLKVSLANFSNEWNKKQYRAACHYNSISFHTRLKYWPGTLIRPPGPVCSRD